MAVTQDRETEVARVASDLYRAGYYKTPNRDETGDHSLSTIRLYV